MNFVIVPAILLDSVGSFVSSEDLQTHLKKHLLKTTCSDIAGLVINTIAADHMLAATEESSLTPEVESSVDSALLFQI